MSPGANLVDCGDLYSAYLEPTYAAKFWLNRYLTLTGQGKLPNQEDVSRLAVIHIRRWATSLVGREMDDMNWTFIVESIACANKLARQADESPFSHIISYGDFHYH